MDFLLIVLVVANAIGSALFFATFGMSMQERDFGVAKFCFVLAVSFASFGLLLASTRLQWIG